MGFVIRGLITAPLKDSDTNPDAGDRLIMSTREVLSDGKISLSSVGGIGAKTQGVGLANDPSEASSERLIRGRLSALIVSE